jgi:exoribonuclease-2
VAPFKPRDADLFAIVSSFDAAYAGYADFQSTMERYWCLRWLAQKEARQVDAVVLKDEILRLVEIPLVLRMPGLPQLARGLQVRLDLLRWDEVDLSVEARLLEVPASAAQALDVDLGDEDEALLEGMAAGEAAAGEAAGEQPAADAPEDGENRAADAAQ